MDPEMFISPVGSFLLCSICGNVLRDPVLHTCGHSFCSACLLTEDGSGVCPNDSESVADASSVIPNLTLKEGLGKLRMHCLYRYQLTDPTQSCNLDRVTAGAAGSLLSLLERPLRRDAEGCDAEVTLGQLDNHLVSCLHRWAACAQCGATVRAHSMERHTSNGECPAGWNHHRTATASNGRNSHLAPAPHTSQCSMDGFVVSFSAPPSVLGATSAVAAAAGSPQLCDDWLSRDQLRTMLANQKRLEEAVSGLGSRLAAVCSKLGQRLAELEDRLQLQGRRLAATRQSPLAAQPSSVGGSDAFFTHAELQQQRQPMLLQHAQRQRESTVSTIPSEGEDSSEASATATALAADAQQHQLTEWTMPFSLTCTGSYCGHVAPIVHLASAGWPSSPVLYSFAQDGEIRAWDAVAGRCFGRVVWSSEAGVQLTCAAAAADCGLLLAGNSSGCLARLSMAEPAAGGGGAKPPPRLIECVAGAHSGPVSAMAGRWQRLFTAGDAEVRVWRLPELSALQHVTSLQREVGSLCLMPSVQRTLLVVCRNRLCLFGVSDTDSAVEPHVLSLTRMLKKNFGVPYCLMATQRHIIVGTAKKGIWLFDAHLGYHVTCLGVELGAVKSLACTPSGNWLLSASLDGSLHVWDVRKQRQVQKTQWHRGPVFSLMLLGDVVYSGSADKDIKIFKYTNLKMTPIYQQIPDSRTLLI